MNISSCIVKKIPLLFVVLSIIFFFPGWLLASSPSPQKSSTESAKVWHVARDGSGQFTLIQDAIEQASSGDTILIKAGRYAEDVTVHSKDHLRIIGEGLDRVIILGEKRVGSLHIGKWPYGATNVTIQGLTVIQHGGLGVGIFNGSGVHLKQVRVEGMIFSQQVKNVHLEDCIIGESETTGVAFANSTGRLTGNRIYGNDHGVVLGGISEVTLQKNVIMNSLFEAVLMTDQSKATMIQNTLVRNGGGIAFQDQATADVRGNIIGYSTAGLVFSPQSQTTLAFNALYDNKGNYLMQGTKQTPAPERAGATDLNLSPGFVNVEEGDFRLRQDSLLRNVDSFSHLGALPPLPAQE